MNYRKIILFLLYGSISIGFCLYQYRTYHRSFEEVQSYTHYYETSEFLIETEENISSTITIPSESAKIIPTESTEIPTETKSVTESIEMTEVLPEITELPEIQFPLELNRATFEELCALPEIGSITAQKIIDFREQNGGFLNLPQLMEISGIGEYIYNLILPYLYLEIEYFPAESEIPDLPEVEEVPEIPVERQTLELPSETLPPEIPVINLNTTSKEQLLLLPDCDEFLADEIILLRDRDIHIFHNITEILFAEHVTSELFSQWEIYLAVDDDGSPQLPYERPYT